jgi:hypothetical protein
LKAKPTDSFPGNTFDKAREGMFCAPCMSINRVARTKGMTAAEVVDMIVVQDDYGLKPSDSHETRICSFCKRERRVGHFGREAKVVRICFDA